MTEQATTPKAGNGAKKKIESTPSTPGSLDQALASEADIRRRALEIRGLEGLSRGLLSQLQPLLNEEIPRAFIQKVGRVKGKPYESTGIKSVQVQIDRLNNVLGLAGWNFTEEFAQDGKLCKVTARILDGEGEVLVERSSFGGVEMASTLGNLYKGSFTNAAKVAFARLGPGHEVYIGIEDLDPDVSEQAAAELGKAKDKPKAKPTPADARITDNQYEILRTLWQSKQVDEEAWKMFLLSKGVERTLDLPQSAYEAAEIWLGERKDRKENPDA